MSKKEELTQLLSWLRHEAGLTYNDIAYLTGVRRVTVANVWAKPPHYISDERLERLRYIKKSLERAINSGVYTPELLPRPIGKKSVLERVRILESLL